MYILILEYHSWNFCLIYESIGYNASCISVTNMSKILSNSHFKFILFILYSMKVTLR